MTDELNRLSSEREETDRRDSVPTGADGVTAVVEHTKENDLPSIVTFELIPDWLKPMEEEDDAVEGDKTMEGGTKKTIPNMFVPDFYLCNVGCYVYTHVNTHISRCSC